MVSIMLTGVVLSEIRSNTSSNGVERARFTVASYDDGTLPLHFEVVAFGGQAERAATFLKVGTRINLFGRMSAYGDLKTVTIALSAFEVQPEGVPTNVGS